MVLPFVRELFRELETSAAFRVAAGAVRARVTGLTDTARLLYTAMLARVTARTVLFFTADNKRAETAYEAIQTFYALVNAVAAPESVVLLPAHDTLPYDGLSPHPDISEKRAIALWKLAQGEARIVVAPLSAAAMRLEGREFYAGLAQTIHRGDTVEIEALAARLESAGYTRSEPVEMVGQYALRGGIVDVFPPEARRPVRLELFGDEVESLREFDVTSQRSTGPRDEVTLLPLTDFPVRRDLLAELADKLELPDKLYAHQPREPLPGWEFLVPMVRPLTGTLFDLADEPLLILEEPHAAWAELDHLAARVQAEFEEAGRHARVRPEQVYLGREEVEARLGASRLVELDELGLAAGEEHAGVSVQQAATQPAARFHGNIRQCADEVRRLVGRGYRVVFFAATTGELERLADIFNEYGIAFQVGLRQVRPGTDGYLEEKAYIATPITSTVIFKGLLPRGAVFPEERIALFGNQDLFDASELVLRPQEQRAGTRLSTFLSDFRDLKVGDFVVHMEHGVGRYLGLKEIATGDDGRSGEFMLLEYANEARLYVPLSRLDLVQKFRSVEGARPVLDRLGGVTWERTKARVKKAMRDMAEELLKLYAQRKLAQARPLSPDSAWQRELEDAFEFSETPDQLTAIGDVKRDLERDEPMDRLLVGDVGYGKTEVAMRATFKAVQDSRQVAVLAPTTILVFQHFETFKQRFAAFPVRVEMLSRFRTPKEQKAVLRDLEAGSVDIVIGTHRLFSKDVVFRDLGLLVIDEEQRFGVRHKERIKQLREQTAVHVLAMSATPIPRTLHMSLVGLRDMSVIETPPKDRLAIQTVVAPFSDTIVRTAIEQELARSGQVYFLHNRVDTIYEVAAKIQQLVSRSRVGVAHGQMDERALERVMLDFVRHQFDILVSTTIIENGLDIPLCNTILVNRAERFGLSELYQLRGRVGRSSRRAYCYLLVPEDRELTELARRRLAAMKEFSDLGAGFKIAALDLELRGAGNLLGAEQHGHINAIGFDLYCQMLERTVRELRGQEVEPEMEASINLGVDIRIPPDYIPEESQRLRMYKRIASVKSLEERAQIERELADRYGLPPPAVRNLLEYAGLKLASNRIRIQSIERKRDTVSIRFLENAAVDPQRLMDFVASHPGAQFTPNGVLRLPLGDGHAALEEVKRLLHAVTSAECGMRSS